MNVILKKMKEFDDKELNKLSIDELTQLFMDNINEQNLKLIKGIEFLVKEDFNNFKENLNYVIKTNTEVQIKKKFESKIFKSKLMFSKADRLKLFTKINDIKNIGEYLANRMLLYKVVFPDEKFKLQIQSILKSLRTISIDVSNAVKLIGTDLSKAHDICEQIKEEQLKDEKNLINFVNALGDFIGEARVIIFMMLNSNKKEILNIIGSVEAGEKLIDEYFESMDSSNI